MTTKLASLLSSCDAFCSHRALAQQTLSLRRHWYRQRHQHWHQQERMLAGHNKWSKIKRKKASNDQSRATSHSKAARAIEAASRACQGDLTNLHLQSALSAARAVQLSKERAEKAVERGANPGLRSGDKELVQRRYDGMLPAGSSGKVAVLVEALTENRNRTAANLRHLFVKLGGELLPTGANEWMFEHVGVALVTKGCNESEDGKQDSPQQTNLGEVDLDDLLECALQGGATDVDFGEDDDDHAMIKCEPNDLLPLVRTLNDGGYLTTQFETQWLVKDESNMVALNAEGAEKFGKFLDSLDEDLDVTNVFYNALLPESKCLS